MRTMKTGKDLIRQRHVAERVEKIGNNLYHYTSLAAFYGMLENKQFWWGNMSDMNDKSELKDFVKKLKKAIKEDVPSAELQIGDFFDEVEARIELEYPFAMCFSTVSDDVAQWDRYADNARGVCIAFNTQTLLELFCYTSHFANEVFYEYDIRNHAHYSILKEFFETGEFLHGFNNIKGLMDNIILCSTCYKHKSFCSEYEFRILTLGQVDTKILKRNCSEISFELVRGVIKQILKVNYSQLCQQEGLNFIDMFDSIIIGPRSDLSKPDLEKFCLANGFEKLSQNIKLSECPLR